MYLWYYPTAVRSYGDSRSGADTTAPNKPGRSNFKKSTRPDTTVKRKADNVHMDVDEAGKVTVFLFANPPSQELRCMICLELFKDPVITPLGHSFCRDCISRHLSNSDRCPVTRRPLTTKDLRPNLMANTLVDELEVHCTYGCQFADNGWELDEDGCTETTTFGLRKAHQKVCEHRPVTCPYGGVRCDLIPRIDLEEHVDHECPYNLKAREEEARERQADLDPLELATYLVVWSLAVFGLMQTEYFSALLTKASTPLIYLTGFPVVLAFLAVLLEYWYNRDPGGEDAKEKD
ncbi:hypothetical protein CYMTET_51543 [Cymbomonas tetramitiformis]|uniref:RING-type domain-containing protein n=1 Tax=Cymbomonas tetramitiformis TaxID=36881 RepID=A0AAE0ESJ2_9CHLO|nr:hypothetical protein CYMTET_51543 [Cymbomonas tetramitiformis]